MDYNSTIPNTPSGWQLRGQHDCEHCHTPVRFEFRRDPRALAPSDEPERELGWGWANRRTPAGGLLVFGRSHAPSRYYYGLGDGCIYVVPQFESSPSLIDQLRAELAGGWQNERERVAAFDPAKLLAMPIIGRATDPSRRQPPIGLLARTPIVRFYLRNGRLPEHGDDLGDLRWSSDIKDSRTLEGLIDAQLEPIRG